MQPLQAPATAALAVEGVSKVFTQWQRSGRLRDVAKTLFRPEKKEVKALDHLDLRVEKGEFVAYAGANGAGKSTTVKILSGILRPTAGSVRVLGLDPARRRTALMARIGVLFGQRSELWWDHPVLASYEWKRQVWNIPQATYDAMLATVTGMLGLAPLLHTCARELSLGQRMRADLGMLLLHNPELIFLDEPTLGLDVLAKKQLIAFLKHINRERGTTILVTSHDMDDLEQMAGRIVLLSGGRRAFDGSFAELRALRGSFATVRVVAGACAPVLPGLRLLEQNGAERLYALEGEHIALGDVLRALAACEGLEDIEIQKAPIEDVIAGLYQSWQT